jgi:hypothetical protein
MERAVAVGFLGDGLGQKSKCVKEVHRAEMHLWGGVESDALSLARLSRVHHQTCQFINKRCKFLNWQIISHICIKLCKYSC